VNRDTPLQYSSENIKLKVIRGFSMLSFYENAIFSLGFPVFLFLSYSHEESGFTVIDPLRSLKILVFPLHP
jgi:hypothetical protein